MDKIDFVIPLRKKNMIIKTTIEGIIFNYHPKNIYVITNPNDINYLETDCQKWDNYNTNIIFINEDSFFIKNYNLTRKYIEQFYTYIDEQSREFGWWYQQLLKLGAYKQIDKLSDPFVVWDSDLIVLNKWEIYDSKENIYKFAILQECAKNEFNKIEYSKSIKMLTGFDAIEPNIEGTFVPHHFIFHHKILDSFLHYVEIYNKCKSKNNWILIIIKLSKDFYRFSEYKCLATFMKNYFPDKFLFYPFSKYGKNGIRYRESDEIIEKIKDYCSINEMGNLCYKDFKKFVSQNYDFNPSYIQIEHVIN